MQIASAKSRSVRVAYHQSAFMGSCLTVSHIDELILVFLVLLVEVRTLHSCKPRETKGAISFPSGVPQERQGMMVD